MNAPPPKVRIIAIAGGSGSGKTTFARELLAALGEKWAVSLELDSYYRDRHQEFDHDGGSVNFDHPDAIDTVLLGEHLKSLSRGEAVEGPRYDFVTHRRESGARKIESRPVVLVEGILLLHYDDLRALFTQTIFIETPESVRFARRLARDVRERGRTAEGVREQFHRQVKPMHDEFVGPSQKWADVTLDGQRPFFESVNRIVSKFRPDL